MSSEPTEDASSFTSLICSDTVIAIMPALQALDDYYLLHVTSPGVITLEKDQKCDFGHTFQKGSDVIVGCFYKFQRTSKGNIIFKRDKKTAIVHKDSVLYVGVELSQNAKNPNLYTLSKTDHEDILCTVSVRM